MFLYTLELEHGCWYVGTTNDPSARLRDHRSGNGSAWTRTHKPIGGFSRQYPLQPLTCAGAEARLQEDAHTKKLMLAKGIELVRGGSYSRCDLTRADVVALSKELYHATNACLRCGRQSHFAADCTATRDIGGNAIDDESSASDELMTDDSDDLTCESDKSDEFASQDVCFRCGRASHYAKDCYARSTIDGRRLY